VTIDRRRCWNGISEAVEAVANDAVDPLDTRCGKGFHKLSATLLPIVQLSFSCRATVSTSAAAPIVGAVLLFCGDWRHRTEMLLATRRRLPVVFRDSAGS
jgi:hypothetical protein